MSCRLAPGITAILLLITTLPFCFTTHGSVFDRNQSVLLRRNLQNASKLKGEDKFNLEITEQQSNASSGETQSRLSSQARHSVLLDETKNSKRYKSSSAFHHSNDTYMLTPPQGRADGKELFQSDSPGPNSP